MQISRIPGDVMRTDLVGGGYENHMLKDLMFSQADGFGNR